MFWKKIIQTHIVFLVCLYVFFPTLALAKPVTTSQKIRCVVAPVFFFLNTPSYCEESFEVASSDDMLTRGVPVSADIDKTTKVVSAMGVSGINSSDIAELIDIIVNAKLKDVYKKIDNNTTTHTIEYVGSGGGVSYTTLQSQSDSIVRSTGKAIDSILTGGSQDFAGRTLSVTGDVTAAAFYGDGSHLTGITSFSTSTTLGVISSSATGLEFSTSTGVFSLTSGYVIPLTASTTEWDNKVSGLSGNIASVDLGGNGKFLSIANGGSVGPYGPTVSLNLGFANNNDGVGTDGRGFLGTYGFSYPMQIGGSSLQFVRYDNGSSVPVISRKTNQPTLVLKAIGSQTSNLQEWQNSSGTVLNVVDASGNVGIGTASPGDKLSVAGDISATGLLKLNTDSEDGQLMAFRPATHATVGMYMLGSLTLKTVADNFTYENTEGTNLMTVLNSGNVGIGTTNPATKLQVESPSAGNITYALKLSNPAQGGGSGTGVGIAFHVADHPYYRLGKGALVYKDDGSGWNRGDFRFLQGSGDDVDPTINDTVMIIKNNGNVGIGTTTPGSKLTVGGDVSISNNIGISGTVYLAGGSTISSSGGQLVLNSGVGETVLNSNGGMRGGWGSSLRLLNGGGSNSIMLDPTGNSYFASGNVGIGTTTPSQKLSVQGSGLISGDLTVTNIFATSTVYVGDVYSLIQKASAGVLFLGGNHNVQFGDNWGSLRADLTTGYSGEAIKFSIVTGGLGRYDGFAIKRSSSEKWFIGQDGTNSTDDLLVRANNATDVLRVVNSGAVANTLVLSAGKVGIGNNSPSVALDVTGDIEYTGTITDVSDERLKENIQDFESGLAILSQIGVKNYNMKNTPGKDETGFIAQNVKQYFPQAVSVVDPENGYMGVSYMSFVPVITKAIQEIANITGMFKDNLVAWLGSATNGITDFFAGTTHQKTLCVGEPGDETCITKSQLDTLLQGAGQTSVPTPVPTTPSAPVENQEDNDTQDAVASSSEEIIPPVAPQVEEVVPTPEPVIEAPVPETPPAPTE